VGSEQLRDEVKECQSFCNFPVSDTLRTASEISGR
jgi:hypothetical protein